MAATFSENPPAPMKNIGGKRAMAGLVDVDVRILALLQRDGRMTMRALGAEVGLSSPAVTERVHRLEQQGAIRGYRADVAPDRVGLPVVAFVTLALPASGRPAGAIEKFVEKIESIVECYRISGEDAYLMKVAVPTMDALGETLDYLGEIGRTRSFIVLSTAKQASPLLPPQTQSWSRTPPSGAD
jgi:Lrp/AsnC family transcriptional regulator, leucine-responsive regulatory protein